MEYAATAFLLFLLLIVLLSALLGAAGVALTQRLVPVHLRKPHNAAVSASSTGSLHPLRRASRVYRLSRDE